MFELIVSASKTYTVTIADDLNLFGEKVKPVLKGEKVAIVTDDRVNALFGDAIDGCFADKKILKIVIRHGEKSKNAKNYLKIINALAENEFTREDTVVALGGGVVGDIAGFVASTYMRGITLIAVPTTLLSMIDSSVGGKTAIDLKSGKNLCGTFYQPSAVYINTAFLKTLPRKEMKNGLGEGVKYALLSKTVTAKDLKDAGAEFIYKCLLIKRDIVEKDERESGARALLNLGHTVGHAVEKLSGYKIPHGACVVKGLIYSVAVSEKLFALSEKEKKKIINIIKKAKINLSNPYSADKIAESITADKKRKGDNISFVAMRGVGKPEIVKISLADLKEIIVDYESNNNPV